MADIAHVFDAGRAVETAFFFRPPIPHFLFRCPAAARFFQFCAVFARGAVNPEPGAAEFDFQPVDIHDFIKYDAETVIQVIGVNLALFAGFCRAVREGQALQRFIIFRIDGLMMSSSPPRSG